MVKQRGIQQRGIELIFGNPSPLVQEENEELIKPQPKIVLYLKDGLNGAERNFTKYPNDIHNVMRENLKEEAEGILYIYLWRESWGYGRNYCRASYATVTKETIIGSPKTAQRAMSRLIEKHFVVKALLEDGQANVTNDGGLYRIITPQEIKNGKTEEGVPLDMIPIEGTVTINMPSVSMVKMTMVKMTNQENSDKTKDLECVAKMTTGQNDYSQDGYGQNDQSSMVNMGMVKMTKPKTNTVRASNESKYGQNDHSQDDQHLKDRYLKDSLSLRDICTLFYKGIGLEKISRQKRERAENNIKELLEEGFTEEDIAFAVKWTIENSREKPYDFSLVKDTIGQAMAEKGKTEKKEVEKLERERMLVQKQAEEKKQEKLLERVKEYKNNLDNNQRKQLHEEALNAIRNTKGIREEFITEILIEAKENEIITAKLGINSLET